MAPTVPGLCFVQQDDEWVARTASWGFLRWLPQKRVAKGQTPPPRKAVPDLFNNRSDRTPAHLLPPAYRHESGTHPKGIARPWIGDELWFCWLPATAWLECKESKESKADAKKHGRDALWYRMALEDGAPFLLAGVCGERDGKYRMAMTMTQCPDEGLSAIRIGHDRMPLMFDLDAIGQDDARPIHARVESAKV